MSFAKWLVLVSIVLAGCASMPKNDGEQVSTLDDDEPTTGTLLKHHQTDVTVTSADAILGAAGKGNSPGGAGNPGKGH